MNQTAVVKQSDLPRAAEVARKTYPGARIVVRRNRVFAIEGDVIQMVTYSRPKAKAKAAV